MEKILLSRLKRDSSTIINKLLVKDDVTIAKENLRIIFPVRFLDNNFATVTTSGIVVMNLFVIMVDAIVTGKQIGRASCRERVLRLV